MIGSTVSCSSIASPASRRTIPGDVDAVPVDPHAARRGAEVDERLATAPVDSHVAEAQTIRLTRGPGELARRSVGRRL